MDEHIETIGLSEHAKETLRRASVEITPLQLEGYEVQEEIGRGTYGVVWRATRLKTGQEVAIKVLDESKGLNWEYFRRELSLLIDLEEHPHTLTILDAQLDSSPPLIVMPLAEGGSLEKAISTRGFSLEQKEKWIEQMVEALDFIHSRGVIHSDLKPSNVLLSSTNDIRIADFGQARRPEQAGALGTLGFMPPEQCEGKGGQPAVSWDVYGFGATAYWMLTGELPRYRTGTSGNVAEYAEEMKGKPLQPIRKLEPEVDSELARIVESCLLPDPSKRTRGFDLVREDLGRRKQRKPLFCRRPWSAGYLFWTYSRWASVRLMLLALVVLAAILGYQWKERQESLFGSHLLKGIQASNTGRYEEAYLHWAEALDYRRHYRPLEMTLGFRALDMVLPTNSPVVDFVLDSEGRQLVTTETSGLVTLWNLDDGAIVRQWPHKENLSRLALDPAGRRLATAGFDGLVRLYDLRSGELIAESGVGGENSRAVEAITFSSDGLYLTWAYYTGEVDAIEVETQTPVALERVYQDEWEGHLPLVVTNPESPKVASLATPERPCVWDLVSGSARVFQDAHTDSINYLAWIPGTGRLLSAAEDGTVILWDADGRKLKEYQQDSPVSVLLPLSSDRFASGSRDGGVWVWSTGQSEPLLKLRLRRPVTTLAHDGEVLAVGTGEDPDLWSEAEANGTINLFSLETGYQLGGPWPCEGPVRKVAFQEGRSHLVSLSDNGLRANNAYPVYVKVWNFLVPRHLAPESTAKTEPASKPKKKVTLPNGVSVSHGDIFINGSDYNESTDTLATAGDDWTVRLWDAETGESLHRPFELRGPARAVAFSVDGALLATASQEKALGLSDRPLQLRVWDTQTGLQVTPILTCPGEFQSLNFQEDGTLLTAVTSSGVYQWDLRFDPNVNWKDRLQRDLRVRLDKQGGLNYEG